MHNRLISNKMVRELDVINKSRNAADKALRNESMCFRIKFAKHESVVAPVSGSEVSILSTCLNSFLVVCSKNSRILFFFFNPLFSY